ncbi:hypothetical protein KJY77_05510 [Canibacter sp. lx-72]|uniref:hypothetical protein n=1 Tax=Canibacter zhuwentaonis TaxID=2837491 RepID=UPI001BDD6CEB|nr:hypothetical protein [Canibacter zhuwentaonis]MBT1018587.1 hypothetical protein [Canibacter zhuwentaonis]
MNGNTLRLVRFLFLFFTRRLLMHSAMKSKLSKTLLFTVAIGVYAGFCALTFVVVRGMTLDANAIALVSQSISLTVGLWTLLFFIVIRILFLKADKLIELTYTFPVTNKQRILAYTVFEAATVLSCVALMSEPLTVSMAIRGGAATFPEIALGIIAQIVVLYLLLDILYLGFDRVLHLLHMTRWRSFLLPCLFVALLYGTYAYANNESSKFLDAFYEGQAYYGISRFYVFLYDRFGSLVASGAFIVSTLIALTLIILVAPNQHSRWKYFFKVPIWGNTNLFGAHLRAVVRSGEFLLATFFVVSASLIVLGIPGYYPPYWLAIISLQAVYAVSTTESIRKTYRHQLSSLQSYVYLAAPYILVEILILIPVITASMIKGMSFSEAAKTTFICLVTLIAALAVSIFFPAEKHNPFSVLMGVVTALGLVSLIAFTTLIWKIPDNYAILAWALIGSICAFYSVIGISSTQRKEYHANV